MIDEDDLLAPYDLSAWEPPPPPAGLADAVLARAKEPPAASAVELAREPRRWGWIAGGVVAVAAVVIAILVRLPGAAAPGPTAPAHGEVIADGARTLSIGATSAALDPGTEVRWRREGRRILVDQPRGRATWNVDADDTLVIDAGAMGASVEATGASLRVEVEMNLADVRTITTSGVTAMAVALVTVVVYEGHVNVTRGGQTVNVVPGTTHEIRPEPSRSELAVGASSIEQAPFDDRDTDRAPERTVSREPARCDEVSCVLSNYAGECCAEYRDIEITDCDAVAPMQRGEQQLANGDAAAALVSFEASLACVHDLRAVKRAYIAACNSRNAAKARRYFAALPASERSRLDQICIRNGISPE